MKPNAAQVLVKLIGLGQSEKIQVFSEFLRKQRISQNSAKAVK
jgi:hypothetical protein